MNSVVILLGTNLGNRFRNLSEALLLISKSVGEVNVSSKIYETAPWGNLEQPSYLNQVIELVTPVDAITLMRKLLEIEEQMGRIRAKKWSPRIIDLDILYFNEEIIVADTLTVPHPFLHERRFVLVPLAEIFPDKVHPVLKKKNKDMLFDLKDQLEVKLADYSLPGNN
jgi:2-amino-4-hydroxy-6-hydroxymethyldihydropteridine diphosphokinase